MPPSRMSSAEYRRLLANGKPGAAWRGQVALPTTCEGIKFPSKIQAQVYQSLRLSHPAALIVREPTFDLRAIPLAKGKPARYRPDFLVVHSRMTKIGALDGFLSELVVEVHEAKGSRAAESRDWRLRAAAARKEYGFLPMFVWRWSGKRPRRYTLEEALS